jgi:hypothetical protein
VGKVNSAYPSFAGAEGATQMVTSEIAEWLEAL